MNFKSKYELVDLITSYANWTGMYREKLSDNNSKPEDYQHLKDISEEKLEKIMEIISTL